MKVAITSKWDRMHHIGLGTIFAQFIATPAYAKTLQEGMTEFKNAVLSLSIPIGIVLLIIAGLMWSLGRGDQLRQTIIGLIFVFAASSIVVFISSIFGG